MFIIAIYDNIYCRLLFKIYMMWNFVFWFFFFMFPMPLRGLKQNKNLNLTQTSWNLLKAFIIICLLFIKCNFLKMKKILTYWFRWLFDPSYFPPNQSQQKTNFRGNICSLTGHTAKWLKTNSRPRPTKQILFVDCFRLL